MRSSGRGWIERLFRLGVSDPYSCAMAGDIEEIFQMMVRKRGRLRAGVWLAGQLAASLPVIVRRVLSWSLEMLKNDLKMCLRQMRRHKAFSLLNLLGLTIGLCAGLVIFQYVNFEKSYDGFHAGVDDLFRVRNDRIYADRHDMSSGCPPAAAPDLAEAFPEIVRTARLLTCRYQTNLVTYQPADVTLTQEKVFYAEGAFLRMFSFPLRSGSADTALQDANTAVITISAAHRYFGDEDPIDKVILVTNNDGRRSYRITAVAEDAPANTHIKFELLLSYPTLIGFNPRAAHYEGWNMFYTYLQLAPDTDPAALEARFSGFTDRLRYHADDYRRVFLLQPVRSIHLQSHLRHEPEVNGDARTVTFLMIIGAFILVIAWVNYISLATARSIKRAREVGVRKVLGSARRQLVRRFLFESALMNALAVGAALALAAGLLPAFGRLIGSPLVLQSSLIWLWAGMSVTAGAFLSGFYPALVMSSYHPVVVLKGSLLRSQGGSLLRKGLVVFQFALSIILIAASLTVSRQLNYMRGRDLGIDIERTLTVRVPLRTDRYGDQKERLRRELSALPAFDGLTVCSNIPGRESDQVASGFRPTDAPPESATQAYLLWVDDNFFDFFRIRQLAGRAFSQEFSTDREKIILNLEAVKRFGYPTAEAALNQKIYFGGYSQSTHEVIGVVDDFHQRSLKTGIKPTVFLYGPGSSYISIKLRPGGLAGAVDFIREKYRGVFPDQPFDYFFLDEFFDRQYRADMRFGRVFGMFTGLAVFIACLGLFGLAVSTAEQRTKEIGIRKVLGASAAGVVVLLSREYLKWVIAANLIAWPVAWYAMSRWLGRYAYHTRLDVGIFILAGGLALAIALMTVVFQALKTALTDPVDSLRYE